MADGKKYYLNLLTGEVILCRNRLSAYLYFKADGKKCGYYVNWKSVIFYCKPLKRMI